MAHNASSIPASRIEDQALIIAESKSFELFDQWMDAQLADLVARWIHTAAPNASRPRNNWSDRARDR
jgi:hypothetical protein